jgi:phage FluMu protein Com
MTHIPTDSFELRNREQGLDESVSLKNKMMACPHCGTPLITTFSIPGVEKYCPKCKQTGDVLWGKIVKKTKKLHDQFKKYLEEFRKIEADLLTGENYDCHLCNVDTRKNYKRANHLNHASQKEIRRHKRALKLLLGGNHGGKK